MAVDLCDLCQLPGVHPPADCLVEVCRKLKLADEMFLRAIQLVHVLGDPEKIKDQLVVSKVLALDLATWRYAM